MTSRAEQRREEWRPVKGTEFYEVSNLGQVRSKERRVAFGNRTRIVKERILNTAISNGYRTCWVQRHAGVHRVVAEAFCDGYQVGFEVNHKDGNRQNNCSDNLEWVTRSENQLHSWRVLGRRNHWQGKLGADHVASRPVIGTDMKTGESVFYPSMRDAARDGYSDNIISKCLRGRWGYRSHKGKTWSYAKSEE